MVNDDLVKGNAGFGVRGGTGRGVGGGEGLGLFRVAEGMGGPLWASGSRTGETRRCDQRV